MTAFNMDALGNRTGNQTLRDDGTVDFTVASATNRYSSIGGNSISHDDAGNTTTDKDSYTYEYDYENRIVKIEDSSSNDVAEYAYDALGRRIKVIDSKAATTTLYYYNPQWQVLAEYNAAGAQQRYYVYGNYIDEPLIMHRESDSEDYYYAQDHLYSVAALINDGGSVVERYEYDAYGKVQILAPNYAPRTTSLYGNPYMFTSRRLDVLDNDNLLTMHYRHRTYDSYIARFLQHDPLGINPAGGVQNSFVHLNQYHDGANIYQYAISNPLASSDPYGLWCVGAKNPAMLAANLLAGWIIQPVVGVGVQMSFTETYYLCTTKPHCLICDTLSVGFKFGGPVAASIGGLGISFSFIPNAPTSGYSTSVGAGGGISGGPLPLVGEIEAEYNLNSSEITITVPKVSVGLSYYLSVNIMGNCTGCSSWSQFPWVRWKKVAKCLENMNDNILSSVETILGRPYQPEELPKTETFTFPDSSVDHLPE